MISIEERISKLEHDINGNGAIGMKEQLAELRRDVKYLKRMNYIGYGVVISIVFFKDIFLGLV